MKKLFLILMVTLLAGCGYTTGSNLGSGFKTVHVHPFKNQVTFTDESSRHLYLPLLEVKIRNSIINRFLFDGNLKIAEPEMADLILSGELVSYDRTALRYTDDQDVEEYRIHLTVNMRILDTHNQILLWEESGFTGETTYFVKGPEATSEEQAIDDAIVDLARRIVERTIENW